MPEGNTPPAPDYLSPEARAEWDRLAPDDAAMADLGLTNFSDLAIYCQTWARMVAAERHVNEHGTIVPAARTGNPIVNPNLAIANRAAGDLQKIGRRHGAGSKVPLRPILPGAPTANQAEYAAMRGVTRAAVTKWKNAGLLVMTAGRVDVAASDARLAVYRSRGMEPAAVAAADGESPADAAEKYIKANGAPWSFDEARRVKENFLALLNQFEYDSKSNAAVAVADVAKAVGAEYATVRTKLLAIPSEQAPALHRLRTVTEVQDALMALIVEALEGLTRDGAPDPA